VGLEEKPGQGMGRGRVDTLADAYHHLGVGKGGVGAGEKGSRLRSATMRRNHRGSPLFPDRERLGSPWAMT
jgi:hypothetical protein